MSKRKIFAVALMLLVITGCQGAIAGGNPAPTFGVVPASQSGMTGAQEHTDEPAAESSEPVTLSGQPLEQALRNAEVLTEHLMNRVFHEGIVERGEHITGRELFYFFTTLPGYMQNPDHPYSNAVSLTSESLYIFPKEMVQRTAYELSGLEGWDFDDDILGYNADAGQYESSLAFGTGVNLYSCTGPQAVYLSDLGFIEVSFELEGAASIDGDPGWEYLGRYTARYQVVEENGIFIRYESIQKA